MLDQAEKSTESIQTLPARKSLELKGNGKQDGTHEKKTEKKTGGVGGQECIGGMGTNNWKKKNQGGLGKIGTS